MKKYYVRLKDYSGSIIDGAAYEAKNKKEAKQFYLNRCEYIFNKTFKNQKELDKWIAQNCPDRKYNNEFILLLNTSSSCGSDERTLISIMTI